MKPQNILLDKFGALKIADFGLARNFTVTKNQYTCYLNLPPLSSLHSALSLFSRAIINPAVYYVMRCSVIDDHSYNRFSNLITASFLL